MVTPLERRLTVIMVHLNLWHFGRSMRIVVINSKRGSGWLLSWMKRRQTVDDFHHAPCCPANHYHRTRLVFQHCTCGAKSNPRDSDTYIDDRLHYHLSLTGVIEPDENEGTNGLWHWREPRAPHWEDGNGPDNDEPTWEELICPFCKRIEFDDVGLKHHLNAGHCDDFNKIEVF